MEQQATLDSSGLTHDEALTWATDVAEAFADHRAAVTALYPYLDPTAEEQLTAAVGAFGKMPTEETLNDQQEELRVQADDARTALFTRWQQFKPWLTGLYPTEPEKPAAWGTDDYLAARAAEGAARRWAEQWLDAYDAYADDPGVADLPAPFRAPAVQALYDAWVRRLRAYHRFQKHRLVVAARRQRLKNDLLALARPFAEAARATFLTDPTVRRLFVQPRAPAPQATASARFTLAPGAAHVADKLDLTDPTNHLSVRLLQPGGNAAAPPEAGVALTRVASLADAATAPSREVWGGRRTLLPLPELGPPDAPLVVRNLGSAPVRVVLTVVE